MNSYKLGKITDVNFAYGYTLDMIGKILNLSRPSILKPQNLIWNQTDWNSEVWNSSAVSESNIQFMSDTNFKRLIKLRMSQVFQPRTTHNLLVILEEIMPSLDFTYTTLANELRIAYNKDSIGEEEIEILTGGYILSPAGCQITYSEV